MPLDVAENVAQDFRVRSKVGLLESEPKILTRLLHEVHQLVDLQEGHRWVPHRGKVAAH